MIAFYNEIDDFACGWLSNLMDAGLITPGYISNESIEDIVPSELVGYDRVHFFAGIGGWDYALNLAGWGNRPVWTGSCPCQPFSTAGKGAGTADERHLWPAFFHLIEQCRPVWVFGEQVASSDALAWLDLVCADLEGTGYTARALDMCAAGFGAPHIRQRLYWVADLQDLRRGMVNTTNIGQIFRKIDASTDDSHSCRMVNPRHPECPKSRDVAQVGAGIVRARQESCDELAPPGGVNVLDPGRRPGPTNGEWRDADWLFCRDGRWRPVESGPQQMADGLSQSLGRLRSDGFDQAVKEMNDYANAHKINLREAMLDVRLSLREEALQRTTRRLSSVSEAPVLLAFVRQLAEQGWNIAQSVLRSSTEVEERDLRMLRQQIPLACSPHQRRLERPQTGEPADAVRILSSILARHAQASWGEAFDRHVSDAFPLKHGAVNRMGLLRGYGNAIVIPEAVEFIKAVMHEI